MGKMLEDRVMEKMKERRFHTSNHSGFTAVTVRI